MGVYTSSLLVDGIGYAEGRIFARGGGFFWGGGGMVR